MTDRLPDSSELEKTEEVVLDPRNLDAQRHALELKFGELLDQDDTESLRELAVGLSPGDLSEILRPMNVEDTARILRILPADPLAEVLAEIDNRSLSALLTLLDVDRIVVSHTVMRDGSIRSRFHGRVFLIDTGAGPAYGGRV